MDCIDRAIKKMQHISNHLYVNEQTWKNFWSIAEKKRLYVFGAGVAADFFFSRIKPGVTIEGIIDNSLEKQGLNIRDICPEAWENLNYDIKISDKSVLNKFLQEEIVVLITSLNYYNQITDELEQMGIKNIFCQLIMEAKEREKQGTKNDKGLSEEYRKYSLKCIKYPINRKKIVFRSFGNYADHEKYITEALLKISNNLDIVWLVSRLDIEVPEGIRLVLIQNWKKMIYELETANIWISDLAMFNYVEKRPEQIYIQTKHWSSITLKKFYLDTVAFKNEPEKRAEWERESKIIDYIITGSDFDTKSCRKGFAYEGKFIQIGSPRSDAMFNEINNKRNIVKKLGLNKENHLILYAPTYRFSTEQGNTVHQSKNIALDFLMIKNQLEKKFGGKWIFLLRLHPSVKKYSKEIKKDNFVIDVSDYEDSQELVSACDITISDYSSIMFEPAFVGKPVFLFATDKKEYIDKEYDLLIDYDTLPFPIAESNEQLAKNIKNFNLESYQDRVAAFLKQYGVHEDGHASERAAEFILKLIEE